MAIRLLQHLRHPVGLLQQLNSVAAYRLLGRGRFVGSLDSVHLGVIAGWAFDRRNPKCRLTVLLKVNGRPAGSTKAYRFRSDLLAAGLGDGCCAFECPWPSNIDRVLSVEVVVPGTGLKLIFDESTNLPLPNEWKRNGDFRLPSFFILGAGKCGTTSLWTYLRQHPEICMSDPKEPFFFEAEYRFGAKVYFNKYFRTWNGEKIVGEARHRNLYLPYVPERIHFFNPNAKLIVLLRNPVERAVSHWWDWYCREKEPLPLKEALMADDERIRSGLGVRDAEEIQHYVNTLDPDGQGCYRTYLDSGYYAEQLERYLTRFSKEQLHVILFDNFVSKTREVVADVFEFLGCNPDYTGKIEFVRYNASPPGMLQHFDAETRSWLIMHYKQHNTRLGQLLGYSLDSWDDPFPDGGRNSLPAASAALLR